MDNTTSTTATTITTATSTTSNNSNDNNGRDQSLRHLHKFSHKISKPSSTSTSTSTIRKPFDPLHPPSPPPPHDHHHRPPPPSHHPLKRPTSPPPPQCNLHSQQEQQQPLNQPPVYNINKNDFRDVVQKLTGAPPQERISPLPPTHAPNKPPSSRLHRIRPPPLFQIANRPPPLLLEHPLNLVDGGGGAFPPPLSPLPPLPSCHAAAESPITAYMRFLHFSGSISAVDSDPSRILGMPTHPPLISPKFNHPTLPQNPPAQIPSQQPDRHQRQPLISPPPAPSPLPFGCFPSPRSPSPLLSPMLLFSPTGSVQFVFPQLPISPRVPAVPSPK
ncbi:hypothetical protein Dimus_024956 [Dionaea muscipula]